ncbi:MAG: hypothetical protein LQ338_001108 [Usnochroma carphineum]|nr:MAG: hypothetical protein LQ338_001108 [Usnochroma carphineum]
MARIRFALTPAATAASITSKVKSKKVRPVSFFARKKGKAKSKKAAVARFPKRAFFIQWFHLTGLDALKMAAFFSAAAVLRYFTPLFREPNYTWPMWKDPHENIWVGPEWISRPVVKVLPEIVPAIILAASPIIILPFMQIFVRNFWDFNAAMMGCLTAVDIMYQLDAFPSGTVGNAFAVGVFLALYLNAKLKVFSADHTLPSPNKSLTALRFQQTTTTLILIISALMGTACAFIGYRTHFHSVFDYRSNHLPFVQGPEKPKPKLPLHALHLPAAIHNHLPSHLLHAPHLNLHMPYIFRHRSAEQKRQDEENRWLAVNFHWPERYGGARKGKGGRRKKRPKTKVDTGVLMAEAIAANVLDAGGGATDAVVGAMV